MYCIEGNIEDTFLTSQLGKHSLDKIAAINVFQDVDIRKSLNNIYDLLKPDGQLRATFIRRETQDVFWQNDETYDSISGYLYTNSVLHSSIGVSPLGYLETKNVTRPFYRVQMYMREKDVKNLLKESGYIIQSMDIIKFPIEMVLDRWSSELHRTFLTNRQEYLLKKWNGFPDSYDVVAQKC